MITLVIGAGGGIGQAVCRAALDRGDNVLAISRGAPPLQHARLRHLEGAANEHEVAAVVAQLEDYGGQIQRVVITTGVLHSDAEPRLFPEKRLEDINAAQLEQSFAVNTVLPLLWVARLLPVLKGKDPCVLAALSARVGSIGDNRLGGWYSYRSSKAALNMALQTAAVEYARRAANVKLLAFHPGTTDTTLSRPFQSGVPEGKLFTPDFVAAQLFSISDGLAPDGTLSYLDWQGQPIDW